jgi:regulatory protein
MLPPSGLPEPRFSTSPALKRGGKKPKSQSKKAEETALRLLARRDYSREEMRRKLTAKGFPLPEIDETIANLEGRKVLDDSRYAPHLAVALAREKYLGPRRIEHEFLQKGIPADLARDAISIAEAALPVKDRLQRMMKRKLKGRCPEELASNEKKKLADTLYRHGFPWEDIQEAMRESGGFTDE